jgi:alanyl-tRNA synthetase
MAQAATAEAGVVFLATDTESATVVLAAGEGTGVDAGATLKAALQAVAGRGGGSATLAQGTVLNAAMLDELVSKVRGGL